MKASVAIVFLIGCLAYITDGPLVAVGFVTLVYGGAWLIRRR